MLSKTIINRYIKHFCFSLLLFNIFANQGFGQTPSESKVFTKVSLLIDNARFKSANKMLDSLISEGSRSKNDKILSRAYNLKGTICKEEEKMKEAIHYFAMAVEINERLKDIEQLSGNYVNLGSIYSGLEEEKSALNYYFKAIGLLKNIKKFHELAIIYNNIGNIYKAKGQIANSKYYLQKALEVALINKDSLIIGMVYHNIGSNMEQTKEYDSAIAHFNHSLVFLSGYDQGIGHVFNYEHLGTAYFRLKKLSEAEHYLLKALEISKTKGITGELGTIYSVLSKIYEDKKQYERSLYYNKLYSGRLDTIYKENSKSEIAKLEFEGELKQQKKSQEQEQKNRDAINNAQLDAKNKIITFSFIALSVVLVLIIFILRGYRQKQKANQIISKQKEVVEQKNEEILSSINYAKRIQRALLTHDDLLNQNLNNIGKIVNGEKKQSSNQLADENNKNYFLFYHPKDIVSGDFYWGTSVSNKQVTVAGQQSSVGTTQLSELPNEKRHLFYLAVCDSTGHGVPGAFMSLLNTGYLSEAISEKNILEPNLIFNYVRQRLIESISKEDQKDGFDGILVCFDVSKSEGLIKITYAAANNAPILIRNNEIIKLDSDNMPVGIGERKEQFTLYSINALPGDTLYLFTDGYADQFGGPKGKKFKYKQLNELLLAISPLSANEQKEKLKLSFDTWKGDLEQVDDVCIIGISL